MTDQAGQADIHAGATGGQPRQTGTQASPNGGQPRQTGTQASPTSQADTQRGTFIVFEGGDGSGKTTQARWLAKHRKCVSTFEPYGGLNLRALLLNTANSDLSDRAEALLFAADRAQHVHKIIKPALKQGQDVICDRYIGSSLAYQAYGRGLGLKEVFQLSNFATDGLLPDLVLLLHIPYETYLARLQASQLDLTRFDHETADFHRRVIEGYLKLAEADPDRWVVIDGTQPPEAVNLAVAAALREKLKWQL